MIHHFFADIEEVDDSSIANCINQTLDHENPREWYWALMDYGSYLKNTAGNASRQSKYYGKQSAFSGSKRQIRGAVIRALTVGPHALSELARLIADDRLGAVLADLIAEGLILKENNKYHL